MEPEPSGQFRFIEDPDRKISNHLVWTRTRTGSDGPEALVTLVVPHYLSHYADSYKMSHLPPT